MPNTK